MMCRELRQEMKIVRRRIAALQREKELLLSSKYDIDIAQVKTQLSLNNEILSDLQYRYDWLSKGHNPYEYRGAHRVDAYHDNSFDAPRVFEYYDQSEQVTTMDAKLQHAIKLSVTNEKQLEILRHLKDGLTPTIIAEKMNRSQQSVERALRLLKKRIKRNMSS